MSGRLPALPPAVPDVQVPQDIGWGSVDQGAEPLVRLGLLRFPDFNPPSKWPLRRFNAGGAAVGGEGGAGTSSNQSQRGSGGSDKPAPRQRGREESAGQQSGDARTKQRGEPASELQAQKGTSRTLPPAPVRRVERFGSSRSADPASGRELTEEDLGIRPQEAHIPRELEEIRARANGPLLFTGVEPALPQPPPIARPGPYPTKITASQEINGGVFARPPDQPGGAGIGFLGVASKRQAARSSADGDGNRAAAASSAPQLPVAPGGIREEAEGVARDYAGQIAEIEAALVAGAFLTRRLGGQRDGAGLTLAPGQGEPEVLRGEQTAPGAPDAPGATGSPGGKLQQPPVLDSSLALSVVAIDEQAIGFDSRQRQRLWAEREARDVQILKPRWRSTESQAAIASDVVVNAVSTKRAIEAHLAKAGGGPRSAAGGMAYDVLREIDGVLHARAAEGRPGQGGDMAPLSRFTRFSGSPHARRMPGARGANGEPRDGRAGRQGSSPRSRPGSSPDTSYRSAEMVAISGAALLESRGPGTFSAEAPLQTGPPTPEWDYATLHRVRNVRRGERSSRSGHGGHDGQVGGRVAGETSDSDRRRSGLDRAVRRRLEMGDSYNSLLEAPADISVHSQSEQSSFFSVRDFAFGLRPRGRGERGGGRGDQGSVEELSSSGYLDALARKNEYRPRGVRGEGRASSGRRGRDVERLHLTSRAGSGEASDDFPAPTPAPRERRDIAGAWDQAGIRGLSPAALRAFGKSFYSLASATPERLQAAPEEGVSRPAISVGSANRGAASATSAGTYTATFASAVSGAGENAATARRFGVTFATPSPGPGRGRVASPASRLAETLREVARLDRVPIVSSGIVDAEARKLVRTNRRPEAGDYDLAASYTVQTPSRLNRALLEETAVRIPGTGDSEGGDTRVSLARSEGAVSESVGGVVLVRG